MNKGLTLIETVIALSIFMIITLSVSHMISFTSSQLERIHTQSEMLESARIAIDVLSLYTKSADSVEIKADAQNNLHSIKLMYGSELHQFSYNSALSSNDPKYHRLDFGGNELASNIASIKLYLNGTILTVFVATDNKLNEKVEIEPITLTVKIKMNNKVIYKSI